MSQTTITGTARCVVDLAASQRDHGWRVTVACPPGGPLPGWLDAAGIDHTPWLAARRPGAGIAAELRTMTRLVARLDPALVHLHSSKAGLIGRLAVRGRRPTLFQPHGWSFAAVEGAVRRAAVGWERVAARWADVIVCVSDGERADGERAGVGGDQRVEPNGVDLERFTAAGPEGRDRAREGLGLAEGPLVVCVGRLCRQKGQDVLLDAWPAVRRLAPTAQLALVGDGPDRAALAGRGEEGVRLVGEVADVRPWLRAATVVAAPSRWEGMSLGVLEAMACARAVVASDVAGMAEVLGPAGPEPAGIVVPPEDRVALAEAVGRRLTDPESADRDGAAGRRRAERYHDLDRRQEAMRALGLEVIGRRRG